MPCVHLRIQLLSWITAQGETLFESGWGCTAVILVKFSAFVAFSWTKWVRLKKGWEPSVSQQSLTCLHLTPHNCHCCHHLPLVIQQYHHYPYPLRSRQRPDKDWGWGRFGNRTSQLVAKPQNLGSNATFLLKWVHFWCARIIKGGKYRLITWILKMQWLS